MPRKSTNKDNLPVTRKSIEPEPEPKNDEKFPEKRGRGRPKKSLDENVDDVAMEIETPAEAKSPTKGKRGRKSKAEVASETISDEAEEEGFDESSSKGKASTSRAARNRSTPAKAPEDVTLRRKSERGAAKAAELRITQASRDGGDDDEADEDDADEESAQASQPKKQDSKKRKADDSDAVNTGAPKKRGRPSKGAANNDTPIADKTDGDKAAAASNDTAIADNKTDGDKAAAGSKSNDTVTASASKKRGRQSKAATSYASNSDATVSSAPKADNTEGNIAAASESNNDIKTNKAVDAELSLNDFVVVERHDVPAADSDEVKLALKSVEDHKSAQTAASTSAVVDRTATLSNKSATSVDNCIVQASESCEQQTSVEHGSSVDETPLNSSLFGRQFVANARASISKPEQRFTLVSYNILADCHAQRSPYAWTPREFLTQAYRHKLLLEELDYLQADIVCLQEVGTSYYPTLLSAMQSKGYEGRFIRRVGEYHDEGEATFYRVSRFTLETDLLCPLGDIVKEEVSRAEGLDDWAKEAIVQALSDQGVVLITRLRTSDGASVTVANTHLIWQADGKPDIHCVQVAQLIRQVLALAGGADRPFILCGDFNNTPDTPVYQVTRDGYPSDSSLSELQARKTVTNPEGEKSSLVNLWWEGFKHTANSLNSAYFTCLDKEPMSSVYPHNAEVLPVDYIWYSDKRLQLDGILSPVNEQVIRAGLPSKHLPSDHVSLKAAFSFT